MGIIDVRDLCFLDFMFQTFNILPLLQTKRKKKKQSMLNLPAIHGVPLCLSRVTNPLSLSKEMADQRRRKTMKKQRSSSSMARESVVVHANQEQMVGTLWNFEMDSSSSSIKGEGDNHKNNNRDLDDDVMHDRDDDDDLSHNTSCCCYLGPTAKAA
ncbi:hypothetical protein S245_042287 [Arachis hypogaea]